MPRNDRLQILVIAAWFALLAGFVEGSALLFTHLVLGKFIWASTATVWMAPLSYLFYFGVIAFLILAVAQLFPRLRDPRMPLFVFSLLAIGSLVRLAAGERLHWLAILLLSTGCAVQLVRSSEAKRNGFLLRMRSTLWIMAALVASGAAVDTFAKSRTESRWISHRSVARPHAQNVLMIVLDCVRASNLSVYGYAQQTSPNLEKWARRGVVFETAIATAPWTLPSHASMFTGRWPHQLSASWFDALDESYPTNAEVLQRRGYHTAALTANFFYTTRETGLDRGFLHFEGRTVSARQIALSSVIGQETHEFATGQSISERASARKDAEEVTTKALAWVDEARNPFFLFLNYFDAHKPYRADERFREAFGGKSGGEAGYNAALASMDEQVNRLLEGLQDRGVLQNTLVVITSDHGEAFGEHGLSGHGHGLYLNVLRVPLIFIHPTLTPKATRVSDPVSLRDVPATLADLLGVDQVFPGGSLARYWSKDGPRPGRTAILSEVWPGDNKIPVNQPVSKGEMVSVVIDSLHYIMNGDGREELYNFRRDAQERRNLIEGIPADMLLQFRASARPAEQQLVRRFGADD